MDEDENVTMIDFPQMVSVSHVNAKMYFERDAQCIRVYFARKFGVSEETGLSPLPIFEGAWGCRLTGGAPPRATGSLGLDGGVDIRRGCGETPRE